MRQSALRSSRSPGRGSQDRRAGDYQSSMGGGSRSGTNDALSPLRSQVASRHGAASRQPGLPPIAGGSSKHETIEEEMNERRRQQELRRQI